MTFTHGINAVTGRAFQEPQETRLMDGKPDVSEGLCGSCNNWITQDSKNAWIKHANMCHNSKKRRKERRAAILKPKPKLPTLLPRR
ncbi:hypothetical protein QBC37DRAFT_380297 [Rhypophila decipiens]|uniref:Uncharacterized protein n=1 Tax=Rhypophila decipiens TaxID=261697 RepID=A0AAN6XV68_9PEZI|nr:hypothetical protein QBC37DRAFT_380297 [Rhypophila decipiens]